LAKRHFVIPAAAAVKVKKGKAVEVPVEAGAISPAAWAWVEEKAEQYWNGTVNPNPTAHCNAHCNPNPNRRIGTGDFPDSLRRELGLLAGPRHP